jgi:hypothetical protein
MPNHYCVRVYANGEAKHTVRAEQGMHSWLDYNRKYRPGCALFVDGKLRDLHDRGYLAGPQVLQVINTVLLELREGKHNLNKPDVIGRQLERNCFGNVTGHRTGYPDESPRESFKWKKQVVA